MGIRKYSRGFTIIEVSMVVAVTGFLLVGMLAGIGISVERQRFTDSVFSTQSHIQYQYDMVENVINNRTDQRQCSNPNTAAGGAYRGGGDCLILGRALVFIYDSSEDESVIKSYAVLGEKDSGSTDNLSSLDAIKQTNPYIIGDSSSNDRYSIPWGALAKNISKEGDSKPSPKVTSTVSIAILRSPKDGSVGLYTLKDNLGTTQGDTSNSFSRVHEIATYWKRSIGVTTANNQLLPLDKNLQICIEQGSRQAALIIQPIGSKDGVTTLFDSDMKESKACA